MFGERIRRARQLRGLSLRQLADKLKNMNAEVGGISHTRIGHYERGEGVPNSTVLLLLARALEVPFDYFFRDTTQMAAVEYRKKLDEGDELDAFKIQVEDHVERWLSLLDLWPESPLNAWQMPRCVPDLITDYEQLEQLALDLRAEWNLGDDALSHVINLVQDQGIPVILTEVDSAVDIDGLKAHVGDMPIIALAKMEAGDRQRFTILHELAHILLEGRLAENLDIEKACNWFAGAFLLPRESLERFVGRERQHIELPELMLIKLEFSISMQCQIFRLHECGIIDEQEMKRLQKQMKDLKYRKKEPIQIAAEQNLLFKQLVYRAYGEGLITLSKGAELLGMPASVFEQELTGKVVDAADH